MSSAEHELYLEAVEASIAAGTHQAMVNIHVDFTSELVTHDTCGFTLWHRRYLLAYENMLRSTAHKFRCVTVPYRNIMDHYVNMINGQCSNLVDCSPILTGLGGIPKNHLVNNRTYAGIFRTVVWYNDRPYKQRLHGLVHSNVAVAFSSSAAPIDTLFYISWHSTVDMLASIWWNNTETTKEGVRTSPLGFSARECREWYVRDSLLAMNRRSDILMTTGGTNATHGVRVTGDLSCKPILTILVWHMRILLMKNVLEIIVIRMMFHLLIMNF